MKRTTLLLTLLLSILFTSALMGATVKTYIGDRLAPRLDTPSFLGYVPNEFIVVLTEEARPVGVTDYRTAAKSGINSLDLLASKYSVEHMKPQFVGAAERGAPRLARYYKIRFSGPFNLERVMEAYRNDSMVHHVEPIGIHILYATPNDPYYDDPPPTFPYDQWHYWDTYGIDADLAWDAETGDGSVVVGILDSGVRYIHGDLGGSDPPGPADNVTNGNVWVNAGETPGDGTDNDGNGYVDDVIGYDFVETSGGFGVSCIDVDCGTADNDPADGDGHGTHVAGIAAAITNNGYCGAGVAGGYSDGTYSGTANGSKIMCLRVGYRAKYRGQIIGVVHMDYCAEAMYYVGWMKDHGVNMAAVNCSWGSSNTGGLDAAVDYLLARDVMVIAGAGNDGCDCPDFLGTKDGVMNVAATDKNGAGPSWTNYGSWVDLAAPGVDVLSTYHEPDDPDYDYIALISGTSQSAPHACGVAALLESCNPTLSGPDKFSVMVNTTTPYNDSRNLGSGILNAKNALDAGCVVCDVVADFTADVPSGCAPLSVQFTDLSTGPVITWSWDFGDGGSSTEQSPSYTYNTPGIYTVKLNVCSESCCDTETKTDYITVSDAPVADFAGEPTSGYAPLTVQFTDFSTNNPTSWSWDFGDGGTSIEQNPSYTYQDTGYFTVTLTAGNVCGSDSETKIDYIHIMESVQMPMWVEYINMSLRSRGPWVNAVAALKVVEDDFGTGVGSVTVSGHWYGLTSDSDVFTTASDGTGSCESDKLRNPSGQFCFQVDNLEKSGYYWDTGKGVDYNCIGTSAKLLSDFVAGEFSITNYPNPFNPETDIHYVLPVEAQVTLEVYNLVGQRVVTLVDEVQSSGYHILHWNAADVPGGIYFYRLQAGDFVQTRKMVLIR